MSEHPGHASPLHPSLSHQVCRRDSDVKRAERGTVAWPKLQHLCPGTRRIPEPPQALRAPSISHPSMGNEAQSMQWAVHTCNNHKTYHDQARQGMSNPTLDLWMLEYEYWEWWLVPTLHKWRRSELERQWVVSPWTAPLELHRMQPLLDGFRALQYSQCSQTAKGLTRLAINLLYFHLLSFQTPSQLFIVSILSS